MTQETKDILKKRFYSYLWRVGMFAAVGGVAYATDVLPLLTLPQWSIPIVALLLSEVTKYLNSQPK